MKRLIPFVGVIVLIVLLVLVNRGINNTAHPDNDDDDASSSQQTKQTKPAAPSSPSVQTAADIPAESIVGDPSKAKYKITVGWVYDEANQANPQALASALQAVLSAAQNSHGMASAEVVDLDVPTTDLSAAGSAVSSLGVAVNGQAITPVNPGEPRASVADLSGALQRCLAAR